MGRVVTFKGTRRNVRNKGGVMTLKGARGDGRGLERGGHIQEGTRGNGR